MLAVTPGAVRKMVERKELAPVQKLDGPLGAYLFNREVVRAFATKRLAEEQSRIDEARRRLDGVA